MPMITGNLDKQRAFNEKQRKRQVKLAKQREDDASKRLKIMQEMRDKLLKEWPANSPESPLVFLDLDDNFDKAA